MAKLALCIEKNYLFNNSASQTRINNSVLKNINKFVGGFDSIKDAPSGLISRTFAEKDENYLQLIPYVALRNRQTDQYFFYTRGELGEEGRLHGMVSIGIGGHIEEEPTLLKNSYFTPLEAVCFKGICRELQEELGISDEVMEKSLSDRVKFAFQSSKVFYSSYDEVSRVHLGIFMTLDIEPKDIVNLEEGVITKGAWHTVEEIMSLQKQGQINLEVWTKEFINLIEKNHF
jgi:predicted NUDIX family phosphoesterase